MLLFQQIAVVLQPAQPSLFIGLGLSSLSFNQRDHSLINGVSGFDLNNMIDQSLMSHIMQAIKTGGE
ncbi:hypothetical protein CMQ_2626 [Grosmannia clavigera kw1407]|uniref:Uncharacterized protein n=1 Tax=Grosmannia clavigera (strain kw1407 / UAMH 11150) TaxID=655863 RepID=F0XHZ7_GROCL|nr:uncharacterized protein CMQ_2626 [Grosmannia clavigera kw1407]EFX02697.1 hypothetical protein CMQ_2626 [Grosmannia clavigera kw1407]